MTVQPDIEFIPCHAFGGGWAVPRTMAGTLAAAEHFGESAYWLYPVGEQGFIVEPQDVEDTVLGLRDMGVTVELWTA